MVAINVNLKELDARVLFTMFGPNLTTAQMPCFAIFMNGHLHQFEIKSQCKDFSGPTGCSKYCQFNKTIS